MARLAQGNSSPYQEGNTPPRASVESTPSPANSFSDKENRQSRGTGLASASARSGKRDQLQAMNSQVASVSKRRRLADLTSNIGNGTQSQSRRSQRMDGEKYYDPDQDENERREIRRGLRDLTRELNDSRSEFMQAGNTGILATVRKANEIFMKVKQTADATIDSRLLVSAADLSHKKTAQLALGDATAGVDVDEFVSKCITFMRRGQQASTNATPRNTQRRTQRSFGGTQGYNGDSDEDEGDALNWDWLGRAACLKHSSRPSVSGFLLGPLSVQKRARAQIQRRARERIDPSQAVRPHELREEDLDKQETANLTTMCTSINKLLAKVATQGSQRAEAELSQIPREEITDDLMQELAHKHSIADDAGVPLFRFCINPRSFGQSVENLFYVSFLVRDGTVGISVDSRQLPTLHPSQPYAPSEAHKKGIQKHQAVFTLDFNTWKEIIETYDITESIIPHREEEVQTTRRGWYG